MAMDPVTAGLDFAGKVTGLFDQWIEDKDLANKLSFEAQKLQNDFNLALVQTQTTPKTDAIVKILFTIKDVIIPLLRPLGSAIMTGFGMYCHYKGIQIDGGMHAVLDATFPGWMASRHVEKSRKDNLKAKTNTWDDDE